MIDSALGATLTRRQKSLKERKLQMNTNKTDKCKFISIIAEESSAQLHCFRSWNILCKMCVLVDDSE